MRGPWDMGRLAWCSPVPHSWPKLMNPTRGTTSASDLETILRRELIEIARFRRERPRGSPRHSTELSAVGRTSAKVGLKTPTARLEINGALAALLIEQQFCVDPHQHGWRTHQIASQRLCERTSAVCCQ